MTSFYTFLLVLRPILSLVFMIYTSSTVRCTISIHFELEVPIHIAYWRLQYLLLIVEWEFVVHKQENVFFDITYDSCDIFKVYLWNKYFLNSLATECICHKRCTRLNCCRSGWWSQLNWEERMSLEQSAALKITKMQIMMSVLKVGFASNQNMPRLMLIMLSVHRCTNPKGSPKKRSN